MVLGPDPGFETTLANLWMLPGATAASASNYVIEADGSTITYLNSPGALGLLYANANQYILYSPSGGTNAYFGGFNAASPLNLSWSTSTTPFIQSGTAATSLTLGPNKAAATLLLASDANQLTLTLDWANSLATLASGINLKLTASHEDISQASAPAAPASGTQRIYTDSADGKLKVIDAAGNITTLGM